MFNHLLPYLKNHKHQIGLELHIHPDQSHSYHGILLEKKKDKIEITDRFTTIKDIETLSQIEKIKELPIALIINGKSILSKKLTNFQSEQNPISQAIPNANPEEFSYELFPNESFTWISMIRKELLENILKELSDSGLNIINVSLGVFVANTILPLLGQEETINTSAYKLTINNQVISNYESENSSEISHYQLGTETVENSLILPFAKAFSNFINALSELHNAEIVPKFEEQFIYTRLFQKTKWIGLVGVFVLLLINFMSFSYLDNKNQKTGVQLSMHQNQLAQLQTLKTKYQEKQNFFKKNSVLRPSKKSWYADQIAKSIPSGISLSKLEIAKSVNKKKRRFDQQYLFDNKTIILEGVSQKNHFLNDWIKSLQDLNWVETVNVLPYSEKENGRGAFELELLLVRMENKF